MKPIIIDLSKIDSRALNLILYVVPDKKLKQAYIYFHELHKKAIKNKKPQKSINDAYVKIVLIKGEIIRRKNEKEKSNR